MNRNTENTPAFCADKLLLRRFAETDFPAVCRNLTGEERRFSNDPFRTEADARSFLNQLLCRYGEETSCYVWCVSLDGEAIGFVALSLYPEAPNARLSYLIGREFRGRGFASASVAAVLEFAFCVLALHRVEAECVKENRASARVLEKCGMHCEGMLREKYYEGNGYYDCLPYAVLDQDYRLE